MLTYPIRCAQESGLFDEIFVSTEDSEIADIARAAGASVIDRPPTLADDEVNVDEVCLHGLEALAELGLAIDTFCCIYATAIFITPEDLRSSLAILDEEPEADIVMGVSAYGINPVKALRCDGDFWRLEWPEYAGLRSQLLPHFVASNGTLYWARSTTFQADGTFYPERLKCYELPASRGVDIDTSEDLAQARRLMDAP